MVTATSEACAAAPLGLTSPAFADGEPIPAPYSGDGGNVSPPLAWTCAPLGTNLVLVVDDVDAPGGSFIHWVVLALTPDGITTADGAVPEGADPGGVLTGTSDAGRPGWIGPSAAGVRTARLRVHGVRAATRGGEPRRRSPAS